MPTRQLDFHTYDELLAEVDRLHEQGYRATGKWNLSQICNHCADFIEQGLDGYRFRIPWVLKATLGKLFLRKILSTRKMKDSQYTPQRPLPQPDLDESEAIARLKIAVERLLVPGVALHDSPFFGRMTPEECRELHLVHTMHHLGFLVPNDGGGTT